MASFPKDFPAYNSFINNRPKNRLIPIGFERIELSTGTPSGLDSTKYLIDGVMADFMFASLDTGTARWTAMGDSILPSATTGIRLEASDDAGELMLSTDLDKVRFIAVGSPASINIHYFKEQNSE